MRVFIIPSWYPSEAHPSTGIFFKEQAILLARFRPEWEIGLSVWGSHEPKLWLPASRPLTSLFRYGSKPIVKQKDTLLEANCVEFLTPAFTWTRKIKKGNMEGIIKVNEENLNRYIQYFGQPDLIHAQVAYPAGLIAKRLSEKHQIPFVITEHQSPFPLPALKGILKSKLLPVLKSADLVLSVSHALKKRLLSFGIESGFTPNYIDDQLFTTVQNDLGIDGAIAVGRLEDQKNYELMLEAMASVQKKIGLKFTVIGSGSQQRKLKRRAQQLGVEVEWKGEQSREVIAQELRSSSIFLNTSKHENQPVAILEALACGLPVVTTNWNGAEEMVSNQVGKVVESWQADDFSDAILDQLESKVSKLKIRGYFEEKYGTQQTVDTLEKFYKSIVKV
ncbi:MAG: hypothetical protein CMB80_14185 [Flammeovirgaceae bacterium]|nr:hypothetical protein [Flammeovirgaceae bacterium]MBE62424.1 hypothetical protein [Flammeovirgaceae bacterium]HCX21724.1 hypothetical protein [Cytophagales bacterium]|tara:strand:- start:5850 stop:7022 length:1173 start_codon:yes stop_codon:yes gene_type:complete